MLAIFRDDGALVGVEARFRDVITFLDRAAALRTALEVLTEDPSGEIDIAWVAEPGQPGDLAINHVLGDRTGLLRGLGVPSGLGLTGKVHVAGRPEGVDDYFSSEAISHTFDRHIGAERLRRLLAVPMNIGGTVGGVLALGARGTGRFGDRAVARAVAVAEEGSRAVAVAERARLAQEIAVHDERSRVAAQLHDNVGALLFAIGSDLGALAEDTASPELAARLRSLRAQTADATTALRESLRTLRSSPSALALGVELRADCEAFSDRTGTPAELIFLDDDPPTLAPSRVEALVAAVREALLNIEKHAHATAVVVTVSRSRDGLVVAVTDNGRGLEPTHVDGIGLATTRAALARLGGSLRVSSELDGGATWRVHLP